jgi:uncharacterized coiled-coil DUF342 family protein
MGYSKEDLNKMVEDLKRQRDELNVQFHLAKAEAKDEWDKLETKWEEVRGKLAEVSEEAGKTTESVTSGLGLIVDEIKKGYERIRNKV